MLGKSFFQNKGWLIFVWFFVANFLACVAPDSDVKYKITSEKGGKFGYQIFVQEKLIIEQPFIPAISEEKSFASKEDAIKVARLVIFKIKKGELPPSISPFELDSLKINYK